MSTETFPDTRSVDGVDEVAAVPRGWAVGPTFAYPDANLAELIWVQAVRRPNAIAVRQWDRTLSYAALTVGARHVADALAAHGIGAESRVAVCVARRPGMVTAVVGVLAAGGAYVPIDPDHPPGRRDLILADARVSVAVVDAAGRRALAGAGLILIDVPERVSADVPAAAPDVACRPDNTAYVLFTSGSTGRPKGVAVAARSVVSFCSATAETCGVYESTKGIAFAALTFDVSVLDAFTVLLRGGTVCLVPDEDRADPERLQRFLAYHGVTWGYLAPALLPLLDPTGLPDLRCLIVGGEATGPEQVARWAAGGRTFLNWYGPTEATVSVTGSQLVGDWSSPLPIGRPLPNHRCYILDETLRPVGVGEPGELYVAGVGLARGYLNEPGLTAERFVPDPFGDEPGARMYRTGDQVRWEPEGLIAFLGRLDNQVKVRGQRVEVGEIEAAIASHPSVAQAAVNLRRLRSGQAQLVAYVTPQGAPDADDLRAHVAQRLPGYMVPGRFLRLDALPLNSSSKVDFVALEALLNGAADASSAGTAWPSPLHRAVADAWRETLDDERAGAESDFVGVGGTSLAAMRLVALLRERLGGTLSVADIFRAGTLGRLADEVAANAGSAAAADEPRTGSRLALTAAQRRLWFIDRLSGHTQAYNIPVAARLRGTLDGAALTAALADVAARHPVLRWRIPDREGMPYVEVDDALPVQVMVRDMTGADALGAEVRDVLRDAAGRPFDLRTGPLWRAMVVTLGSDDHVLAITVHHIVFDGWSLPILYAELGRAYANRLRVGPASCPAVASVPAQRNLTRFSFADYAAWLEQAEGTARVEDRGWWRSALAGVNPIVELPADRVRPPVATFHGASVDTVLPAPIAAAVRVFARDHHVTEYAVMLAAFGVLIGRLTGSADFLVGAPAADRRHPAFDEVVGFLVDTLPVRLRVDLETDFIAHAKLSHDAVMNAIAHRAVPFEALVDDLRVPRDLSRNPLIQVLFNMYSLVGVAPALSGIVTHEIPVEPPGSLFDLTMYVIERDEGMTLQAVYNPDLYDRDRMRALVASYVRIVEQCVAAPHNPVGAGDVRSALPETLDGHRRADAPLPILSDDPQRACGPDLPRLNEPLAPTPSTEPLSTTIARICDAYPERVAISDDRLTLTYADVSRLASAVRQGIATRGVRAGETVGVVATRTAQLPPVLLGVLDSGARWLLIDPTSPARRSLAQMRAARARLAIVCGGADGVHGVGDVPVVSLATMRDESADRPAPTAVDDRIAVDRGYFMATSGTTGEPLIVCTPEEPLTRFLRWYVTAFQIGPTDITALLGGLTHDPVLRDAFTSLTSGGRLYVPRDAWLRDPATLAPWLAHRGVTILHLTPSLGRLLCRAAVPLPHVRVVVFAGDRLNGGDVAAMRSIAPNAAVVNGYGTTETPQLQAMQSVPSTDDPGLGAIPVGRGINGNEVHVVTACGAPAAVGELGHVLIRGRNLASGYVDADLTAARFDINDHTEDGGDRMFRTGDLGRYNARGEVTLAGRSDGQVKLRGFRIELGEIDAALATHPDVSAAAAAVRHVGGEPFLVAYAVPLRAGVSTAALREHIASVLPEYACPAEVVLLPELPMTRNGKVDRSALPPPGTVDRVAGHAEAATPTERQIVRVWREVLGLPRISVTDNFFDIGGNSLAIVAVQARLLAVLGTRIEIVDLFRFPNIRALAGHVDGGKRSPGLDRAARRVAAQRHRATRQPAGTRSLPTE